MEERRLQLLLYKEGKQAARRESLAGPPPSASSRRDSMAGQHPAHPLPPSSRRDTLSGSMPPPPPRPPATASAASQRAGPSSLGGSGEGAPPLRRESVPGTMPGRPSSAGGGVTPRGGMPGKATADVLLTLRGQAGGGAMPPPPLPVPRLRLGEVMLGPQRPTLADEADVVPGRGGIWALPPPPLPSERAQRAAAKVPLPDDPDSTLATPRTPAGGNQVRGE